MLVHLVNGAGRRPLATNIPLTSIKVKVALKGRKVASVKQLISGEPLMYTEEGQHLTMTLPRLDIWECLYIKLQQN
ncbi:hypothetical protein D3C78_1406410 [compost metagenome]